MLLTRRVLSVQCPTSAYIHIPFCRQRCFYCDFAIMVPTNTRAEPKARYSAYVDVLLEEIKCVGAKWTGANKSRVEPLATVYFGGGTPSLMPPSEIDRVLRALDETFGIKPDAEITLEADPGTFTPAEFSGFVSSGINRINLGVQSFDDGVLVESGRTHTAKQVLLNTKGLRHVK
eukprot:c19017_g1_i2.p1 GENE.c19017_g1_i2~~c19017_g1_i2.p1  ORF type:complete len:175 (-),score=23.92 c19017_g1_i2:299-823(-)